MTTNETRTALHADYDPLHFERAQATPPKGMTLEQWIDAMIRDGGMTRATAEAHARVALSDETWLSDRYQVSVRRNVRHGFGDDAGQMAWLSIKRIDRQPIHDWRDLQEIKNRLIGRECEAVEIYPADWRLVDEANQYHLWALCDPRVRFPFGFNERLVGEKSVGGSVQRPFAPEHAPDVVRAPRDYASVVAMIDALLAPYDTGADEAAALHARALRTLTSPDVVARFAESAALLNAPMPWCEPCGSYHHESAPHITSANDSASELDDQFFARAVLTNPGESVIDKVSRGASHGIDESGSHKQKE